MLMNIYFSKKHHILRLFPFSKSAKFTISFKYRDFAVTSIGPKPWNFYSHAFQHE